MGYHKFRIKLVDEFASEHFSTIFGLLWILMDVFYFIQQEAHIHINMQ